jgi:hypothetical protein
MSLLAPHYTSSHATELAQATVALVAAEIVPATQLTPNLCITLLVLSPCCSFILAVTRPLLHTQLALQQSVLSKVVL